MVLHNDTNGNLAEYLQISESRFSAKMNETNGAEFTQSEIRHIVSRYNLSPDQTSQIFFA